MPIDVGLAHLYNINVCNMTCDEKILFSHPKNCWLTISSRTIMLGEVNEIFLNNYLDNDVQSTKIFTKREQREADDNSIPLADVIATSDVNSTDDQIEVVKKDVIQHASDEKIAKNDVPFKDSNSDESAFEKSTSDNGDKSDDDNANDSRFQDNFSRAKYEESFGSTSFPYGIENWEGPRFDLKRAKKFRQKSVVPVPSSDGNESKVKKFHLSNSLHLKSSTERTLGYDDSIKKSKINVSKANSKSNVEKADQVPNQNISIQSKQSGNHVEQSVADTYAEFLRDAKTSVPIPKHIHVESDDDLEMNEVSKKSLSSKKTNKYSMVTDEKGALSGPERNDDRMEDSKEDDSMQSNEQSENEDKLMDDDQDTISTDDSGMDSEDDTISGKNSRKESEMNVQPKTENFSTSADQSEMESDDGMTSGKSSDLQSGIKVQSKMEATAGFSNEKDHSDGSDEEHTTEIINGRSGSKGSEDDSMGSGKNYPKGFEGYMDSGSTQEKDFKSSGEDSKEHSLDSTENSGASKEDTNNGGLGSTEDLGAYHEDGTNLQHLKTGTDTKTKAKDLNTTSTDSASEDSSVINIGDETNVKGSDMESENIDSMSGDSSGGKMADDSDLKDLSTADLVSGDAPGTEPDVATDHLKSYDESSNTDTNSDTVSSGGDKDLEQSNGADTFHNNLDTGSRNSNKKEAHTIKNKAVNSNEVNKEDSEQSKDTNVNNNMDTGSNSRTSDVQDTTPSNDNNDDGKVNLKHVNNKQNMLESKSGPTTVSATMTSEENSGKELRVEKNSANKEDKEVKAGGRIIETSYRLNDEDTPDDDDYLDQGTGGGGGGFRNIRGVRLMNEWVAISTIRQQMVVTRQLSE